MLTFLTKPRFWRQSSWILLMKPTKRSYTVILSMECIQESRWQSGLLLTNKRPVNLLDGKFLQFKPWLTTLTLSTLSSQMTLFNNLWATSLLRLTPKLLLLKLCSLQTVASNYLKLIVQILPLTNGFLEICCPTQTPTWLTLSPHGVWWT